MPNPAGYSVIELAKKFELPRLPTSQVPISRFDLRRNFDVYFDSTYTVHTRASRVRYVLDKNSFGTVSDLWNQPRVLSPQNYDFRVWYGMV